jgi:hypothetical protein
LGIGGFIFSFLRYSNYKETVQLQNDNIKALQDNAVILQRELEKHKKSQTDNLKAIARLEGQVDLYKELPLRELAEGIKSVSVSNDKILKVLEHSQLIAAEDRDILTKQSTHTEIITKPSKE